MVSRRQFLHAASWTAAGLGAGALGWAPNLVLASVATDHRFVFIIQRGAADGLHTVVPYAEPAYATLRGPLAVDPSTAFKLNGTFALHPSLAQTAQMYQAGQALFVHAIASPYRDRSHFDGQNVLETGGRAPYQVKDGWLNRLVGMLPKTRDDAIAVTASVPLALRGAAPVTSYAPSGLPPTSDDLMARVAAMYERDPQLKALWAEATDAQGMARNEHARGDPDGLGKLAASFLVKPDGPRIAMLETGGWDTHTDQAPRLNRQLKELDTLLAALRDGLGDTWNRTTVLVATEFGRTAAVNGTAGTDHGEGSVALLVGGAVRGGRVLADWPGLRAQDLYDGRDLKPTASLDALIAGAAGESLGLDPERVARTLFKDAGKPRPMTELIRKS